MKARVTVDYPLVLIALLLSFFGVAMVYSAGRTDVATAVSGVWRMQVLYLALGLGAAWLVSRASVRLMDWATIPSYAASLVVLVLLLFFGGGRGTAKDVKSWLMIGGVTLGQPSEIAKIVVVLLLAKILAARRAAPKSIFDLWSAALVVGIPWVLVMLQPDLGTGLVFIAIFFAMLFWAGASWQLLVLAASPAVSLVLAVSTGLWGAWFLLLMALVLYYKPFVVEGVMIVGANVAMGVVAPLIWERLKPHQQSRLLVFLDPSSDPLRSGYHVIQSQVAIGSGGWLGKGFTEGTQKRLAFLPAQHTDFIFPVVGEEFGFLGVVLALGLFTWFVLRCVRTAARSTDAFASLVAFGLVSMMFAHIVENIGMTVGVMPVTGIPLPFFSYGGSFMLTCWIAVGMLVRLSSEGRGKADTLAI